MQLLFELLVVEFVVCWLLIVVIVVVVVVGCLLTFCDRAPCIHT